MDSNRFNIVGESWQCGKTYDGGDGDDIAQELLNRLSR